MEANKDAIETDIGEKKFKEEMAVLQKLSEIEAMKGKFIYQEEDIDNRDDSLRQTPLHEGYGTLCGIKGSKLSGG